MRRRKALTRLLLVLFNFLGAASFTDLELFDLLPPCEYEDSANCYWDSGNRGNGIGDSFYDIRGNVYYTGITHK